MKINNKDKKEKNTKSKTFNTIGMNISDKKHTICVLDSQAKIIKQFQISNTKGAIIKVCESYPGSRVIIEIGTHSPWISRLLQEQGMQVIVANARKLKMIYQNESKSDKADAQMLASVGKLDPELLSPIKHIKEETQIDLQKIKSRDILVKTRTKLILHIRSSLKSIGERLPSCSADYFATKATECLKENKSIEIHEKIIEIIAEITQKIKQYDKEIKQLIKNKYTEAELLQNVHGVGPITALAFLLCIGDPKRFKKSRLIGAYLGLVPRQDQSGNIEKQLRITKCGNSYLRALLVNCSQHILGHFGKDSDLRKQGLKLATQKGKKKAVVAIARKLSVLLLSIIKKRDIYQPFFIKTQ